MPRRRGPGEWVNAELKNGRGLREFRSCSMQAPELVAAVQTPLIASADQIGGRSLDTSGP